MTEILSAAGQSTAPIIRLENIRMNFQKPTGASQCVLSDIDLELRSGEVLGLLGRSGSGKSTLLRIAGGLIKPTSGSVRYLGKPLEGPAEGIGIVFQTFALYPWLTVLENVSLGLDALGLSAAEVRKRAEPAIDLIGLEGFEQAYPRELSGGMRQRVGFARALVSDPILLLMDEPFSALDVLTAETLRTEFLDLWTGHLLPTKAVLMVTHNIEEAVLMCNRILILGATPGRIVTEVPVLLPQPRNRQDPAFREVVDELYSILTARVVQASGAHAAHPGLAQVLPDVSPLEMTGFLEALAAPPRDGVAELAAIAPMLSLGVNRLLPLAAAVQLLEFAELKDATIRLTAAGRVFAQAGQDERKQLFKEHLTRFVPLAGHIRRVLDEREDHRAPRNRIALELEDHLSHHDAEKTLKAAIGWGRYAEIYTYNDRTKTFARPAL